MIVPIRSGEWSQWAGRRDEEYFVRLLNGYGWRIAVKNQDFKRIVGTDVAELFQDEPETMSVDAVASYWDPCKQRYEAVFIEAKRRTNKPTLDDIHSWINKCRSAQQFVEESYDIQRMLCAGIPQLESMQCSKSILFIDCDSWKNTWSDRLVELLPLQQRTSGSPRRIQIIDQTRAIWMQHTLDILGLLRSPLNTAVREFKVYYWKRGLIPMFRLII
ncbi:hypothetical protein GCM10025857_07720 [Alicyclobacillus contaminans]|uniref:hypothetical protein n=1 Tax=Alicyclobacillus contaminans TaxID=392016 RepID=UPI0012EBF717|nr:hypothetical protein [Alicyclobacillus contaminans]GMA49415.1 hypothetical protein GCM10025857_07720 [Alicyclobacillus contaminans]